MQRGLARSRQGLVHSARHFFELGRAESASRKFHAHFVVALSSHKGSPERANTSASSRASGSRGSCSYVSMASRIVAFAAQPRLSAWRRAVGAIIQLAAVGIRPIFLRHVQPRFVIDPQVLRCCILVCLTIAPRCLGHFVPRLINYRAREFGSNFVFVGAVKTGVTTWKPSFWAAQPRCVSRSLDRCSYGQARRQPGLLSSACHGRTIFKVGACLQSARPSRCPRLCCARGVPPSIVTGSNLALLMLDCDSATSLSTPACISVCPSRVEYVQSTTLPRSP